MPELLTLAVPEELLDALAERVAAKLAHRLHTPSGSAPASPWLDLAGACAYTGLSKDALYKLTAAKAIPFRRKTGGQGLRFHRGELHRWMETRYPRVDRLS